MAYEILEKTATYESFWSQKDNPNDRSHIVVTVKVHGSVCNRAESKNLYIGQMLAELAEKYLGCTLVKKEDG